MRVVDLDSLRVTDLNVQTEEGLWNLGVFAALSIQDDGSHIALSAMAMTTSKDTGQLVFDWAAFLLDLDDPRPRRLFIPYDLGRAGAFSPTLSGCGRYVLVPTQPWPDQPIFSTSCLVRLDLHSGATIPLRIEGELLTPWHWSASSEGDVIVMDGLMDPNPRSPDATGLYIWRESRPVVEPLILPTTGGRADGKSSWPSVSADGSCLAFVSKASNLVADDTNEANDAFLLDLRGGELRRISVATDGRQVEAHVQGPLSVSVDGRFVAFVTHGQGLDPLDHDQMQDAFVHDRQTRRTLRVNVSADGTTTGTHECGPSMISGDGSTVVFATRERLVPEDENTKLDVYVRRLDWESEDDR